MKHRIGLIGTGGIANFLHLPGIEACPDLELVALCDIDPKVLNETGDKYGIGKEFRFSNHKDLINCNKVDAVDIVTSNDAHFEIAMAAAAAGKPYSLEKPVTMNAEQSAKLLAATAKLPNMVCFSYRFMAAARFARDIIKQNQLGVIHHINMQYLQAWGGFEYDAPLVWRFQKDRAGSGALGDLGCHALDLVRFILDREYLSVCAHSGTITQNRKLVKDEVTGKETVNKTGKKGGKAIKAETGKVDVDDFCNYMADMEDGISASFQITRYAYGRNNYQRLEIYGSKGALVYKLDEEPGIDAIEVCIGGPMRETFTFTKLPTPGKHKSNQMQAFADILNKKGDGLAATIEDGHKNQLVVDAVLKSAEKRIWVNV